MASTHCTPSTTLAASQPITVSKLSFGADWTARISSFRNERSDTKNPKPNEDRVEVDAVRQVVIVADGVTRTKGIDGTYPNPSPSAQVAALFCATVKTLAAQTPVMTLDKLQEIVSRANQAVALSNRQHFATYDFAERDRPGLAAVVGIIDGDSLWLASIADCWCIGVDTHGIHRHAWEKTSHSRQEYVRLGEISARETLRNKLNHPLSYGAITGEPEALSFVEYKQISIASTSRLVFATDGLLRIPEENPGALATLPAEHLIRYGCILDRMHNETDDKTIVILDRHERRQ